MRKCIYYSEKL